jgi:hypothetical protein
VMEKLIQSSFFNSGFRNSCPPAGNDCGFVFSLCSMLYALPVLRSRRNCVGGCALRSFERANFFIDDTRLSKK